MPRDFPNLSHTFYNMFGTLCRDLHKWAAAGFVTQHTTNPKTNDKSKWQLQTHIFIHRVCAVCSLSLSRLLYLDACYLLRPIIMRSYERKLHTSSIWPLNGLWGTNIYIIQSKRWRTCIFERTTQETERERGEKEGKRTIEKKIEVSKYRE